jgi:hypothetical protein
MFYIRIFSDMVRFVLPTVQELYYNKINLQEEYLQTWAVSSQRLKIKKEEKFYLTL